ncbi:MAG TPA: hypothetical protein VGB85_02595 [Nannocystis sp.]|jgi:hypothetical protein
MRREVILCAALVAVACSDHRYGFFGDEDGETTGSPDPTDGREPNPDPTGVPGPVTVTTQSDPGEPDPPDPGEPDPTGVPGVCGERVLPSELPLRVEGDNSGGPTFFGLTCGFGIASEAVFVWTAPFDGVFRFDTAGSSFDTVLAVTASYCGGPELGCNDDALGVFSAVTTLVPGGETVTIVVEGKTGEEGPVVLNIHEESLPCSFADIGSELGDLASSTTFGPNVLEGSCGGLGANETPLLWRAPFSGLFRFETFGSAFDPVLYIRQDDCNGPEIRCNDDREGVEAGFDLFVDGGQPLLVVVDGLGVGHAGDYTLRISAL